MNILKHYFLYLTICIFCIQESNAQNNNLQKATFGGGSFWTTEAIFKDLKGIHKIESGYSGGESKEPNYKSVCTGETGHAEVIQITFDNSVIKYKDLLNVFFETHNPTTLNKQGNDIGTQYRSILFFHNNNQKMVINLFIRDLNNKEIYANRIVTAVNEYTTFYKAERYHQNYYSKNKDNPYCKIVIKPKIKKFKNTFKHLLKETKLNHSRITK